MRPYLPEESLHDPAETRLRGMIDQLNGTEAGFEAILAEQLAIEATPMADLLAEALAGQAAEALDDEKAVDSLDWQSVFNAALVQTRRQSQRRHRVPRWWGLAAALLLLGMPLPFLVSRHHQQTGVGVITSLPRPPAPSEQARTSTATHNDTQRTVTLPPSPRRSEPRRILLGAGGTIDTVIATRLALYGATTAEIAAYQLTGTARYAITHGHYQNFCVETPHATIRVVGTRFTVTIDSLSTRVMVEEGTVEVVAIAPGSTPHLVSHGAALSCSAPPGDSTFLLQSRMVDFRRSLIAPYTREYQLQGEIPIDADAALARIRTHIGPHCDTLSQVRELVWSHRAAHLLSLGALPQAQQLFDTIQATAPQSPLAWYAALQSAQLYLLQPASTRAGYERLLYCAQSVLPDAAIEAPLQLLVVAGARRCGDQAAALFAARRFIALQADTSLCADLAWFCAESLRLEWGAISQAHYYYEMIADRFSSSRYAPEALRWATWCMIQQSSQRLHPTHQNRKDSGSAHSP